MIQKNTPKTLNMGRCPQTLNPCAEAFQGVRGHADLNGGGARSRELEKAMGKIEATI